MKQGITIALAGNPNSGKSTVFNNLTGMRQHVGNYPGVTVEKKEGSLQYKGHRMTIVDLPGTYSLSAHSLDEIVARNFLVEEKPDVVIDVIDTSNLERNLYLAVQLMELEAPLLLALNMADQAEKMGLIIDHRKLSDLLGVPSVMTIATKNVAMDDLLEEAIRVHEGRGLKRPSPIRYGREIESQIRILTRPIVLIESLAQKYPPSWLALKILEQDEDVIEKIRSTPGGEDVLSLGERCSASLKRIFGDDPEVIIAERRYGFISGACDEAVRRSYELRHSTSDMIDMILLNRVLGLPVFFGLIWLVFKFVFHFSKPLMRLIEILLSLLGAGTSRVLAEGSVLHSLVADGIIGGVGSVIVFLPVICLLYFALALLEDTGYLARVAFLMDKFMHTLGLHGRSFIPMLLGFGCNLPGIMATRTIEDKNDRLTTLLIIPFMSCGARLPIYILFIGAFFPEKDAGNILFSLYGLGILVGIILARLFRKYLLRGKTAPFVMELPPYRMPTMRALLIHMWERGAQYLKKAGTIIFAGCMLMWFLSNFPRHPASSGDYDRAIGKAGQDREIPSRPGKEKDLERLEKSYAGILGKALMPVFRPLGFKDWRLGIGLVGGFFAKEIVVATLGTLYSAGTEEEGRSTLRMALRKARAPDGTKYYSPLVAYSLMIFCLLYLPCLATLAVIRKETNSWLCPLFTVAYTLGAAWLVSFIIFQAGCLLGLGA